MTQYTVHFTTVASTWRTVEADDPEGAIEKAHSEVFVSICHQCAREVEIGDEFEPVVVFNEDTGETAWRDDES